MSALQAGGFPEQQIRARARHGTAEVFPPVEEYGAALFGAASGAGRQYPARRATPRIRPTTWTW